MAAHLLLLHLLALPPATAAAASQHEEPAICVDPHGSGGGGARCAATFATIGAAQRALRAARPRDINSAAAGPRTVYLHGGTYGPQHFADFAGGSWGLGEADSGTAARPLRWASYPGEQARITGAVPITFSPLALAALPAAIPAAARAHVVVADLRVQGLRDYGNLTVRLGLGRSVARSSLQK